MKIEHVKKIDRYAGLVLCLLLSLHYRIVKIFTRTQQALTPKNILFLKYFGMGSIILAQSAVLAVKKRFPDAKIYFLTFSANKDILKLFDSADEVLHVSLKPLWRFFPEVLKTVIYLRKQNIDIAFDLEFFSRFTSIMTYLSGARERIEFYSEILWRGDLYTHGVKFNSYFHIKENFLRLVKEAVPDMVAACETARPKITQDMQMRSRVILQNHGVTDGDKKVCVNINAGELAIERRWPAEYFVELINKLSVYDVKFLMIGAEEDVHYVSGALSRLRRRDKIIDISGKTTIPELAGIFYLSSLLITNDSGPLHLADSVGIPVAAFFGPETPAMYGPGNGKNIVFYQGLTCSPCLSVLNAKTVTCTNDVKCMNGLKPDEIYTALVNKYPEIFKVGK